MRDVFRPCYQLEQLFVRGVANVRHCILCIARDAELIGGAFRGTATRNHSTKISSQRRRFIQWPEKNWGQFPVRVRVAKSNIPIFIWVFTVNWQVDPNPKFHDVSKTLEIHYSYLFFLFFFLSKERVFCQKRKPKKSICQKQIIDRNQSCYWPISTIVVRLICKELNYCFIFCRYKWRQRIDGIVLIKMSRNESVKRYW